MGRLDDRVAIVTGGAPGTAADTPVDASWAAGKRLKFQSGY